MDKLLQCYPFSDQRVRLVEGFSAYDGTIGDPPGEPHKGIDYVRNDNGSFLAFDVYAMHDGIAFQGTSESWGTYVVVHAIIGAKRMSTIYAHLADVDSSIAQQFINTENQRVRNEEGTMIRASQHIGVAGTTGRTNGITQLHIELHEKDLQTNASQKIDPYGINDRASSGRYPQPGTSLQGLDHAWTSDEPKLAK